MMRLYAAEDVELVRSAFDGPSASMRTVGGVSRHTGLPEETVEKILRDHSELFLPAEVGRSTYKIRVGQKVTQPALTR